MTTDKLKVIPGINLLFKRVDPNSGKTEYCFHKRINTGFFDSHWALPGGHIEEYETPKETAIREAKEELGVDLTHDNLKPAILNYRIKKPEQEIRPDLYFVVEKWEGELRNSEPEKHENPSWHSSDDLPEPMVPHVKKAILEFEKGSSFVVTYT